MGNTAAERLMKWDEEEDQAPKRLLRREGTGAVDRKRRKGAERSNGIHVTASDETLALLEDLIASYRKEKGRGFNRADWLELMARQDAQNRLKT